MLIQARLPDGRTLPFGAEVHDAQDQVVGVVGQAGRIMARVSQATGKLSVDWSDQDSQPHRCSFDYRVPAGPSRDRQGVYATEQATCLDASTHAAARSANG
jgi:outer membrane usher protein